MGIKDPVLLWLLVQIEHYNFTELVHGIRFIAISHHVLYKYTHYVFLFYSLIYVGMVFFPWTKL